jgi:hypothetical protein
MTQRLLPDYLAEEVISWSTRSNQKSAIPFDRHQGLPFGLILLVGRI